MQFKTKCVNVCQRNSCRQPIVFFDPAYHLNPSLISFSNLESMISFRCMLPKNLSSISSSIILLAEFPLGLYPFFAMAAWEILLITHKCLSLIERDAIFYHPFHAASTSSSTVQHGTQGFLCAVRRRISSS